MVRTQVYLTTAVHRRLKNRGQILGKSLADQVREAVERYLASDDVDRVLKDDPIWTLPDRAVTAPRKSPADLAAGHDKYLYGERSRGGTASRSRRRR